jgi:hypothetical protein
VLLLHRLLDLPGEYPLDGDCLGRFVRPLVLQKVIEGGADASFLDDALPHCSNSFIRLRASTRSSSGIATILDRQAFEPDADWLGSRRRPVKRRGNLLQGLADELNVPEMVRIVRFSEAAPRREVSGF